MKMINVSFQYAVTVGLSYRAIELHPEKILKIKPFINKHKSKGINYLSKIDDWKTFQKNNRKITLNNLIINEKYMCPAYI